jgi:hypothetical protein
MHFGAAMAAEPRQEERADRQPVEPGSLVRWRPLAEGGTLVGTSVAVALDRLPPSVLIGLVVARGLAAFSGALWEGARTEVVAFGRDAAAAFFRGLRRLLHI